MRCRQQSLHTSRIRKLPLLLALSLVAACATPELRLQKQAHSDALQSFAKQVFARLPARLGEGTDEAITVLWDPRVSGPPSAADSARLFCGSEGVAHSLGRAERKQDSVTIYLHPALQPAITASESTIPVPCSAHKDLRQLARAALVHQVAHLYAEVREHSRELETEFKFASKSPFLAVDRHRSPDTFEARSGLEHFAVNVEYFVLDSEFECRKPFEARKLQARIGAPRGEDSASCESHWRVGLEQGGYAEISPAEVREIRYLHVEREAVQGARWGGHGMFQLVRCHEDDEACDRDVVISLRSNILDSVTHTLSGLSGSEPGRVRVYRLGDVIAEYAGSELRDLKSVPLALDSQERARLLALFVERYWADNGLVAAGSRNSGSEARQLLKAALGSSHPFWKAYAVTSAQLLSELRRTGLARAYEEVRIASRWSELEEAFERLNEGAGGRWSSLKDYLLSTRASERRQWAMKVLSGSSNWLAQAEAFDRMESWIRASIERRTEQESVRRLADFRQRKLSAAEAKALLRKVGDLRSYDHETQPRHLAADLTGYGIPLARDFGGATPGHDRYFVELSRKAEQARLALAESRRAQFPEEARELTEVASNLSWVRERIASATGREGVSGRTPASTEN